MTIQINMDKSFTGEKRQHDFFKDQVETSLKRFESHISRIEVHLKDENGKKEGVNDMTCILEARIEGLQPIAVTKKADTIELAVTGAIDKIKTAIETIVGKMQSQNN